MTSISVKNTPDLPPKDTLEERFRRLAAAWHRETAYLSSMTEANSHPVYQEIIQLGPAVVPLLLRDLEAHHNHWFAALRAITGAEPIPPSSAGDIPKMAEAWLCWAKNNGYREETRSFIGPLYQTEPSTGDAAQMGGSPRAETGRGFIVSMTAYAVRRFEVVLERPKLRERKIESDKT